jgi:hypothetical protein
LHVGFRLGDLLLSKTERARDTSAQLDQLEGSGLDTSLEGGLETSVDLGDLIADLVVGHDVLEDGMARGATTLLQGGDSGVDHDVVLGVVSRLGSGNNVRHDDRVEEFDRAKRAESDVS